MSADTRVVLDLPSWLRNPNLPELTLEDAAGEAQKMADRTGLTAYVYRSCGILSVTTEDQGRRKPLGQFEPAPPKKGGKK